MVLAVTYIRFVMVTSENNYLNTLGEKGAVQENSGFSPANV